jgi:hypothetical protein
MRRERRAQLSCCGVGVPIFLRRRTVSGAWTARSCGHVSRCRLATEWVLFCINMLACPDCSGKCAIGPEQHGLGPENRKFASSLVGSGNNRSVARVSARFSGTIATAMARPGRIGPEIPAETGHATRQHACVCWNLYCFPDLGAIIAVIARGGIIRLAIHRTTIIVATCNHPHAGSQSSASREHANCNWDCNRLARAHADCN